MGSAINAKHAAVIDVVEGVLPSGNYAGQRIRMELRESTDQKTRFVKIVIGDGVRRSYQYSGKNLGNAKAQIDEMREALAKGSS